MLDDLHLAGFLVIWVLAWGRAGGRGQGAALLRKQKKDKFNNRFWPLKKVPGRKPVNHVSLPKMKLFLSGLSRKDKSTI